MFAWDEEIPSITGIAKKKKTVQASYISVWLLRVPQPVVRASRHDVQTARAVGRDGGPAQHVARQRDRAPLGPVAARAWRGKGSGIGGVSLLGQAAPTLAPRRNQAERGLSLSLGPAGGPGQAAGLLERRMAVSLAMSKSTLTPLLHVVDGAERGPPRAQTARAPSRWGVRAPRRTRRAAPPSLVESRRAGACSAPGWAASWWVLTTARAGAPALCVRCAASFWQPLAEQGATRQAYW